MPWTKETRFSQHLMQFHRLHKKRKALEPTPTSSRVVKPLITVLGGSDVQLRRNAAEALVQLGGALTTEPLIASLGSSDGDVRRSAAEVLGILGENQTRRSI
jgi:hypothetical protein